MANTVPTQPSSSTSPPPTAMRDIQMLICVICSKCTPTGQDDSVANVAAEIAQEVWLMDCTHTICEYCKDGVRRAKTPSEIPRCKRCRKRVKVDKLLRIFPYETIPPPSHEFRNNQHKLALERLKNQRLRDELELLRKRREERKQEIEMKVDELVDAVRLLDDILQAHQP